MSDQTKEDTLFGFVSAIVEMKKKFILYACYMEARKVADVAINILTDIIQEEIIQDYTKHGSQ